VKRVARVIVFGFPYAVSLPFFVLATGLLRYETNPRWLQAVVLWSTGLQESVLLPLTQTLAALYLGVAFAILFGFSALLIGIQMVAVLKGVLDISRTHADVVSDALRAGTVGADAVAIRREMEVALADKVRDAEERLRGEWRFVVGLITAALLGAVAIFSALK